MTLAPFPWFGGKSRAAPLVWAALGPDVSGYIEPFAGSLAVLLSRPSLGHGPETVNDADGLLCNFWRAVASDPDAVAQAADWPVNEADLSARHLRLVAARAALTERLQVDADYYDAKLAGWWVWGACAWIGTGWCSGEGPWNTDGERWIDRRKLPHLGDEGKGINRQLPHLGDEGMGINRQLPHLGDEGKGIAIRQWMHALATRMRGVRVACGDWARVTTYSVQRAGGFPCGVLLDPPYPEGEMAYSAGCEGRHVWHAVREWAKENGSNPDLRIVLCGYDGAQAPTGWRTVSWEQRKGYASTDDALDNAARETLWLSPACLDVARTAGKQSRLFGAP